MNSPAVIAAVEAGGTSFVVAICHITSSSSPDAEDLPTIVARHEVDSSHDAPTQTIEECCTFLLQHKPPEGYHALGIASFGPVGLNPSKMEEYGTILNSSPKAQWRDVDLLTPLREACQGTGSGSLPLKIRVDTDVNAPAMAEYLHNKDGDNISSLAYVTVGTGIGVGLVVNDKPVHGRMHPEGGHVPVQPLDGDNFGGYSWGGKCPFKGWNTVEGLASSVALTERYQQLLGGKVGRQLSAADRSVLASLPDDHEIWDHAANALANLCATLLLTLSMEKIVLGGGLMKRNGLLEKIQKRTVTLINGYLDLPDIATVITTSRYGSDAGLVGTIVLAQSALVEDASITSKKGDDVAVKRTAYNTGLWHGTLVGIIGTALVCKYCFLDGGRRR